MKILCAAALLLVAPAWAQVRPDAGSLQRDLEQQPLEVPRAAPKLPSAPARPAQKGDETQRFTVSALKISGNSAFDSAELLALVRGELVGKSVTLAQLRDAAARITEFYRARGYLVARAYIPAQRIAAGGAEIEIAVLEGVLGEVKIENRSRLSDATVARFLEPLQPGAPLTMESFERPVLLLSDQAGAGAVGPVIRPGASTGLSDLALEVGPGSLFAGQVEANNHGSRTTGRGLLTGQLGLLSPLGLGESLSAGFTESFEGLSSATLRGALPLGGDGFKVGASYVATRYELGEEFAVLEASGTARSASAFASAPLVRKERWNLNASLSAEHNRFEDRVALTDSLTSKQVRSASATLAGDVRDPLLRDGVLVWSATLESGRLAFDQPAAQAADAAAAQTQGKYMKYSLALLYLQSLHRDWSVYASLLAQDADRNLDSSEKLALGGPNGVRAYPVGEAAGDQGALGTLELRYALPRWLGTTPSVVLFADAGRVRINKVPFAAGDNSRSLGAAGLGFTLATGRDFSLRAYWAAKTTTDEPATADKDQSSRGWVQAVKYF